MNSALPKSDHPLDTGEDTLRLIATLLPPDGLAERMQAGLRNPPRAARVLPWRRPVWLQSSVVRSAAAAAIVCVIAGGGWRVYMRVQPPSSAKVLQMPSLAQPSAGFSPSGAMRVPQSLDRPVLTHPPAEGPAADTRQNAVAPQVKAMRRGKSLNKRKAAGKVAVLPPR